MALSGDISAEEKVTIELPDDGDYRIAVHGYDVTVPDPAFSITIAAIQGSDIAVSPPAGPIHPGQVAVIQTTFTPTSPGEGVIFLGPVGAPTALTVRSHATP